MKIHIVQQGDTLWKIAKKYNVDFEQLKSMNTHLSDPDYIMPGMKIKIPSESVHVKKHKKEAPVKKEEPVTPPPKKEAIEAPPPPPKKPFVKKKKEMISPAYEFEPMPEENIPMPPKGATMMKHYPMMPQPMAMPYSYSNPPAMPKYDHHYPMMPAGMKGKENLNVMAEMDEESSSFMPNIPHKKTGVLPYTGMNEPSYPQMPMMNPMPPYGGHPMHMGASYYPSHGCCHGWMPNYYDPNAFYGTMPGYYDPNVLHSSMPMPNPAYGYQAPLFDDYGGAPGYREERDGNEAENHRNDDDNEETNRDESL